MIKKFLKENSDSIPERLHLGCGERIVSGWLNCDVIGSQVTIDLAWGRLPFESNHFTAVCAQHLIEHLWIDRELEPLLGEVYRCMKSDGELWLSCPDLAKVCKHYCEDKGIGMLEDRLTRFPDAAIHDYPASHMINRTFHQGGEHKNLFDFDLLKFILEKSGFEKVKNENELSFLTRFPEFPKRGDDYHSLYVSAKKIR